MKLRLVDRQRYCEIVKNDRRQRFLPAVTISMARLARRAAF
jgi:hypothetical protein